MRKLHWWQGILARSLFAVLGIAIILGGLSVLTAGKSVAEREHGQSVQRLGELLDTVESSASIACFSNDEQLAAEVAQGLMRNREVLRVAIRAGEVELARVERDTHENAVISRAGIRSLVVEPGQVRRNLRSPFQREDIVGEIVLDADWSVIDERVAKIVQETVWPLAGLLLLVAAASAAMMLFLVVRPLKATSDRLHRLEPASGQKLDVPDGHENTELGRLVSDINDLTGHLVTTLEQERSLRQQQAKYQGILDDLNGHLVATLEQERSLRQQQTIAQRKYQDIFDHAASGIFIAKRDGCLESFNRAFVDLTWLPRGGELVERNLAEPGWQAPDRLLSLLHLSLDGDASVVMKDDFLVSGRFGDERWLHVAMMPLGDGSVQGTVTDVTQRKHEEISARRMAVVDPLTGFANRVGLERALAETIQHTPHFSLLMLDLDGFRQVNDAMGIPIGDHLLLMASVRIRECLKDRDIVARIGGDEFALVLLDETDSAALDARISCLLAELAQAYSLPGASAETVTLTASLGVAAYPQDGANLHQLLRGAELALSSARDAGGNCYRHYMPAMLAAIEHRRRLEDDLRHALTAGELHLAFQPIVNLASGRMVGAEALLRWAHPVRGSVSPEIFVPIAEEIGLIGEIGRMVLADACRQVAEWRQAGLDMYVSVNVSARQIPDELRPETVREQLEQLGLPVHAVAIEITEGVLMSDVSTAQGWIDKLRASGLRVYLDDFGTGYSSLSYLKRFPMDTVKIDKSFIRDMSADNSDRTLVEAIVRMAKSLGLNVVAEGVETRGQYELLRQLGCGYGQGYLFSRPVSGGDFPQVVEAINQNFAVKAA